MTRTKNSLINLIAAMVGQAVGLFISFIGRIFFIHILGTAYLGINGLFTNILTILSLVELGIGPAIVYSLYKPLAEQDTKKVKALMHLYKVVYTITGIIVAVLGICITPFLHYFIKNVPDISNLNFIFILFVLNSAISYFFAYKRNLIIADQHRYIATIYRYAFFAVLNILQILFLYITKSYIVFLILEIMCTLLENIAIARRANQMYPFLMEKGYEKLDDETMQQIKKNTGAMVLHKIGGIVVNSTDNILISAKVGIMWVGLYSNYQLIISALNTIIGQFFTAIIASVGNLAATESKEKVISIFYSIFFVDFWIFGICAICLFELFNPFIGLWLGKDLLMTKDTVTIIVLNFYIQGMRRAVLTFRDALGLYWYDRYKPLFEVVVNLTVSLMLAPKFGIMGIFVGTFVSTMSICFWIEPYVLYRHGFRAPLKSYFFKYTIYTLAVIIAGFLTEQFVALITETTISAFVGKVLICLFISNTVFLIFFYRTKEFQYLFAILRSVLLKKYVRKKTSEC